MKRLLIVNVHYAPHAYGGATVVAENMARHLAHDHGWKVVVVTSFFDSAIPAYGLKRYRIDGTDVIAVNVPRRDLTPAETYANPGFDAAVIAIAESFRPHVAHVHSIQTLGASFLPLLKARGIKVALTVHDAWWWCERQFMVTGQGRYCHQIRIDPAICRGCVSIPEDDTRRRAALDILREVPDLYLFPSAFFHSLAIANGFDPARSVIHRNGVSLPGPGYRRSAAPEGVKLRFGFVGGPGPNKGAAQVVGALRSISRRDYELVIVDAAQNNSSSWRSDFDWRVPGRLTFHPAYTMANIDDFFARIDVLLFPSQWKESFGLTVREAMARNVWVVASDAGGLSEDCSDGINGNVIPMVADHGALAACIENLLSHHDPRSYGNPLADRIVSSAAQASELDGLLARLP